MSDTNRHNVPADLLLQKVLEARPQRLSIHSSAIRSDLAAENLANGSLLNQLTDLDNRRRLPPLMADKRPPTGRPRRVHQLLGMGHVLGQRPLDKDVLAGLYAGQGGRVVDVDAGADDDEVNVLVVGHGLGVAVGLCLGGQLEDLDGALGRLDAAVAEGYDLVLFAAAGGQEVREVGGAGPGCDGVA